MKKGYVQTEIIKFLNSEEKKLNRQLNVEDVFKVLPDLFKFLKDNQENGLENLTFDIFRQNVEVGYMMAEQDNQLNAMNGFFK